MYYGEVAGVLNDSGEEGNHPWDPPPTNRRGRGRKALPRDRRVPKPAGSKRTEKSGVTTFRPEGTRCRMLVLPGQEFDGGPGVLPRDGARRDDYTVAGEMTTGTRHGFQWSAWQVTDKKGETCTRSKDRGAGGYQRSEVPPDFSYFHGADKVQRHLSSDLHGSWFSGLTGTVCLLRSCKR